MKFFKLLFLAVLSLPVLTGCERQLVSPVDPTVLSQTTTIFAQKVLSDLADTAAKRGFVDLANAANDVAETLAIDDGTSVEPMFSRLAKLADAVTILEHAFVEAGCEIELQKFAEASMDAVKAYTIRDAAEMEQTLQNLTQEALKAQKVLQQLPVENGFMPFTFGYGPAIDATISEFFCPEPDDPLYEPGLILIQYDSTIRPMSETKTAVTEFLALKGYTEQENGLSGYERKNSSLWFHLKEYTAYIQLERVSNNFESIDLGADVDPLLIMGELMHIPGVNLVQPFVFNVIFEKVLPPDRYYIMQDMAAKYNEAWCQGNFDVINNMLIERIDLDFFDYTFVQNLADIYAEEIPETAEQIQMNRFFLRRIAELFLYIYFLDPDKNLDEIINRFRESVRTRHLSFIGRRTFFHYYHTTDYWKQLVTDHLNK